MTDAPRLTAPPWDEAVATALETAEVAVSGFYAIRPREWTSRFRYDVASALDHPDLPFRAGTLAQIVGIEIAESPRPPRWRIVLRDPVIFRLARRHGLHVVLAYTLAHELVHLVRFASGLAPFDASEEHGRTEEEARVCRVARESLVPVLAPDAHPSLDQLAGV